MYNGDCELFKWIQTIENNSKLNEQIGGTIIGDKAYSFNVKFISQAQLKMYF